MLFGSSGKKLSGLEVGSEEWKSRRILKDYSVYESSRSSRDKRGKRIYNYDNGKERLTAEFYDSGKGNATEVRFYRGTNEKVIDGMIKDNELEGQITFFSKGVKQREGTAVCGVWYGIVREFDEYEQMKSEIQYVNGIRDGTAVFFGLDGFSVLKRGTYENDHLYYRGAIDLPDGLQYSN